MLNKEIGRNHIKLYLAQGGGGNTPFRHLVGLIIHKPTSLSTFKLSEISRFISANPTLFPIGSCTTNFPLHSHWTPYTYLSDQLWTPYTNKDFLEPSYVVTM